MNYEVERALSRKVDDWEFRSVEGKVSSMESNIHNLGNDIDRLKSTIENQNQIIRELLDVLIQDKDHEDNDNDCLNEIILLRNKM